MSKVKTILLSVVATIAIILGISLLVMYFGEFGVFYTKTVEKHQTNAEREVFKESLPYTEQAAQFLAKSYREYNKAKDKDEKASIKEYVAMKYPNLDIDAIDNMKLRSFYNSCIE